jgi:hypothetical protein
MRRGRHAPEGWGTDAAIIALLALAALGYVGYLIWTGWGFR